MREWDDVFAARLTRDVLDAAVEEVPDTFLEPGEPDTLRRRRAAYSAFLWKRLKPPRAFADLRLRRCLARHEPGRRVAARRG